MERRRPHSNANANAAPPGQRSYFEDVNTGLGYGGGGAQGAAPGAAPRPGAQSYYQQQAAAQRPTASAASSTQPSSPSRRRKPPGAASTTGVPVAWFILLFVGVAVVICTSIFAVKYNRLSGRYAKLEKEHHYVEKGHKRMMDQLSDYRDKNRDLNRDLTKTRAEMKAVRREMADMEDHHDHLTTTLDAKHRELQDHIDEHHDDSDDGGVVVATTGGMGEEMGARMEAREKAILARVALLKEHIQTEGRREVTEKFGPGPHRVKMYIRFPDEEDKTSDPVDRSFIIELAPLDLMPHSVHFFLEQVAHSLWDGCAFVINAPHVVQASTVPSDSRAKEDKLSPFKNANLGAVSFQEYTPKYPHEKYTVGFAGRPGGPDFYVNMLNNTISHGPGGQLHHDLEDEADPCFGKVVDGFDTLAEMRKLRTAKDLYVRRVMIAKAEIVSGVSGGENEPVLKEKEGDTPVLKEAEVPA